MNLFNSAIGLVLAVGLQAHVPPEENFSMSALVALQELFDRAK